MRFFFNLLISVLILQANNATANQTQTEIIPLPVYSTLPQEGSTYGAMPVFMTVEKDSGRTRSIIAPSLTWNEIISLTGTFRWYYYPTRTDEISFIPSVSLNTNKTLWLQYQRRSREPGQFTLASDFNLREDIFYRYFGIGPQTQAQDETSYTRVGGDSATRIGVNVLPNLNLGGVIKIERNLMAREHVKFLPLTHDKFPNAPGMAGATTVTQGASIVYDTREHAEFSERGFAAKGFAGYGRGFNGSKSLFGRFETETLGVWKETDYLQGAARAFWGYTPGSDIPIFNQMSLGGSNLLRGFTANRFIDQGAWEIEFEQRLALLQTHIYGVIVDWRIDPFIAVGQVYDTTEQFFKYPQLSVGVGFRAYVRPNILGRIDVAMAGEGPMVYVELGYPF